MRKIIEFYLEVDSTNGSEHDLQSHSLGIGMHPIKSNASEDSPILSILKSLLVDYHNQDTLVSLLDKWTHTLCLTPEKNPPKFLPRNPLKTFHSLNTLEGLLATHRAGAEPHGDAPGGDAGGVCWLAFFDSAVVSMRNPREISCCLPSPPLHHRWSEGCSGGL